MPHLKFTRDHRGYENTFLVDTVRRRGREQTRVLYWFRTPPQVKVGRAAIDEDAIRAIEDAYPGVAFDWNRILDARPPEPEVVVDDPRRRPKGKTNRDRDGRRDARPERPPRPATPAVAEPAAAPIRSDEPPDSRPSEEPPAALEAMAVPGQEPLDASPLAGDADAGDVPGDEDERFDTAPETAPPPAHASEPSAAERILGSEGLIRLRARHAEVCARIAAQVAEAERQQALRTLAEQLNPDAWVTESDVRAGLEQFEQVLDQVRREVGPIRKRTRRGGRRNRRRREMIEASGAARASETPGAAADQHDNDEPEDGAGDE